MGARDAYLVWMESRRDGAVPFLFFFRTLLASSSCSLCAV
jgi:hypothetical protein